MRRGGEITLENGTVTTDEEQKEYQKIHQKTPSP